MFAMVVDNTGYTELYYLTICYFNEYYLLVFVGNCMVESRKTLDREDDNWYWGTVSLKTILVF